MPRHPRPEGRARRPAAARRAVRSPRAPRRGVRDADYIVYTDGGANPNPGYGGWGVVIVSPATGERRELSGGEDNTTNNRMELLAAIRGLLAVPEGSRVELVTDSNYLRRGITEWVHGWRERGWQRLEGNRLHPVKNRDLWEELIAAEARHAVTWHWIRGHAGHEHNERADRLATEEIERLRGVPEAGAGEGRVDAEVVLRVTCSGGNGAWAARVRHGGEETLRSGRQLATTANRLDLLAAIETLAPLPERARVVIATASDYLKKGAREWLPAWKHRGWVTVSGSPVQNRELWQSLDRELSRRHVEFRQATEDDLAALGPTLLTATQPTGVPGQ